MALSKISIRFQEPPTSCSPPQHHTGRSKNCHHIILSKFHLSAERCYRSKLLSFCRLSVTSPLLKDKSLPSPYTSCDYSVLILCISGDRSSKAAVHDMSCHEKAAGFYEFMMSSASAASCVLGQKNKAHFRSRIQCANPAHQWYRVVYGRLVRQI